MNEPTQSNRRTSTWRRPELRRVTTKTTAEGQGPGQDAETASVTITDD